MFRNIINFFKTVKLPLTFLAFFSSHNFSVHFVTLDQPPSLSFGHLLRKPWCNTHTASTTLWITGVWEAVWQRAERERSEFWKGQKVKNIKDRYSILKLQTKNGGENICRQMTSFGPFFKCWRYLWKHPEVKQPKAESRRPPLHTLTAMKSPQKYWTDLAQSQKVVE